MKKLTAGLAVVLLALICASACFYFGGTLSAEVQIRTARASEYPELYESIREQLRAGSTPQQFTGDALSEDASAYTLVDITVVLRNRGLLPAEWLHASTQGLPGDIAVYAISGEGSDIPARSAGQVSLKLITTAAPDAKRAVTIQYYVYGLKRSIKVG